MILVEMRPGQLQDAVKRNLPVIMAAGVVEYHGPHLPIGTDYLIANSICKEVERRCECILAPGMPFGPTMMWAGSAAEGEMDFNPEPLFIYAKEVFRNLIKVGFHRIYVLQFHQGPEGLQALCLKKAAAELIREEVKTWGEGWGRNEEDAWPVKDIFGMIRIAGPDSFSGNSLTLDFSHAAKGETQFVLATYPETVNMEELQKADARTVKWLGNANDADGLEGTQWFEYCVNGWVSELSGKG